MNDLNNLEFWLFCKNATCPICGKKLFLQNEKKRRFEDFIFNTEIIILDFYNYKFLCLTCPFILFWGIDYYDRLNIMFSYRFYYKNKSVYVYNSSNLNLVVYNDSKRIDFNLKIDSIPTKKEITKIIDNLEFY